MNHKPETPTERIAVVALVLFQDGRITTGRAAELAGISYQGANQMLERMSRTIPLYRDEDGYWVMVDKTN